MDSKERKKIGSIMIIVGFLGILANAADYLMGWNRISPAIGIFGLLVFATGMYLKGKKKK